VAEFYFLLVEYEWNGKIKRTFANICRNIFLVANEDVRLQSAQLFNSLFNYFIMDKSKFLLLSSVSLFFIIPMLIWSIKIFIESLEFNQGWKIISSLVGSLIFVFLFSAVLVMLFRKIISNKIE
jgi:hypothetical protein